MILLVIALLGFGLLIESWMFMLFVGMAHLHILEAIQPVSYEVSCQFALVSLPFQVLAILLGSLKE